MSNKRLVLAYLLDVLAIVAFGFIGFGFNKAHPHYHAFSLVDLSISYPYKKDTVTNTALWLGTVMGPALVIAALTLLAVPRPALVRQMPKKDLWTRKFWELFVGLMGLALSLTTMLMIVQGLKNVVGKPRPDAIARCMPDLSNIPAHTVGGYGQPITDRWVLVDQTICTQTNTGHKRDAFRSWPSGHAATSFAGLFYLALWLSTKFHVAPPLLPASAHPVLPNTSKTPMDPSGLPYFTQLRDEGAAAPTWLLFLPYIPIGFALYISGSRYFDYRHHGWDIIAGALIGTLTAYLAYRYYHVPLTRSAGWAFAPRSPDRAFGVGVGEHGYVDNATSSSPPSAFPPAPAPPTFGAAPPLSSSGVAAAAAFPAEEALLRRGERSDDVEMGPLMTNGGVSSGVGGTRVGGIARKPPGQGQGYGQGGGAMMQSGYESLVGSSAEAGSRG